MRALFKSVGLLGDAIDVFTEATLMWRRAARSHLSEAAASVSAELLAHFRHVDGSETLFELLHAVRKLAIAEERQKARHYAEALTVEAA